MKSIADQLPPEIAQQIHPDRRKNEAEYWAVRDQLLGQYRGHAVSDAIGRGYRGDIMTLGILRY